jgi:hypothetical protein
MNADAHARKGDGALQYKFLLQQGLAAKGKGFL